MESSWADSFYMLQNLELINEMMLSVIDIGVDKFVQRIQEYLFKITTML